MVLTPHSGGLESKDFVKIVFKVIEKYLQNKKIKYKIEEVTEFNTILNIVNPNETLLSLNGLIKLVRLSPYGKNDKVHTSLMSISIAEIIKTKNVIIQNKDLKWDFFKSTGPGGQHKNKTLSSARLTHLPTNTVVIASKERSQHDNKTQALKQLEIELEKQQNNKELIKKSEVWNNKINPKDELITFYFNHNFVINNITQMKSLELKKVLNGDLDLIM